MLNRCDTTKPYVANFSRYGGRGITVCEQWKEFSRFLGDLGECPDGMSLDRIDSEGNYELNNCRWATIRQQSENRSTTKLGQSLAKEIREKYALGESQRDLAKEYGVTQGAISLVVTGKVWR